MCGTNGRVDAVIEVLDCAGEEGIPSAQDR